MQVKELMTRHVATVLPSTTVQNAAERMRELDVGALPVTDGKSLLGIISDRDITVRAIAEGCDPTETLVSEVMSPEVIYCFDDDPVEEVARVMRHRQIRRIPILNHAQELIGMVALADLAIAVAGDVLSGEVLEGISQPHRPPL